VRKLLAFIARWLARAGFRLLNLFSEPLIPRDKRDKKD